MADGITRRDFVMQAGAAGAALLTNGSSLISVAQENTDSNKRIVSMLGACFIPSKPGDPGYADLESHGISDFVMQKLPSAALSLFNDGAKEFFGGKAFIELEPEQKEQYLALIEEGSKLTDPKQKLQLQAFYRGARSQILTVYYKNFPLEEYILGEDGLPKTQPGDTHQVTNPNVWKDKQLVTGWDIAGYKVK
jgi:hypothetical protein